MSYCTKTQKLKFDHADHGKSIFTTEGAEDTEEKL